MLSPPYQGGKQGGGQSTINHLRIYVEFQAKSWKDVCKNL